MSDRKVRGVDGATYDLGDGAPDLTHAAFKSRPHAGQSPCFVMCGKAICRKHGCLRVYEDQCEQAEEQQAEEGTA